jgi:hypothetical protein
MTRRNVRLLLVEVEGSDATAVCAAFTRALAMASEQAATGRSVESKIELLGVKIRTKVDVSESNASDPSPAEISR